MTTVELRTVSGKTCHMLLGDSPDWVREEYWKMVKTREEVLNG
jgi:hypothetical protein